MGFRSARTTLSVIMTLKLAAEIIRTTLECSRERTDGSAVATIEECKRVHTIHVRGIHRSMRTA